MTIDILVRKITTEKIQEYLMGYQKKNKCGKVTILYYKNPIRRIHKVKIGSSVREIISEENIDKGMLIKQVQQILGHRQIDKTLRYAMVKQNNVKNFHKKCIG